MLKFNYIFTGLISIIAVISLTTTSAFANNTNDAETARIKSSLAVSISKPNLIQPVNNNVKLGLAQLPLPSLPGSKVRTAGVIELLVLAKAGISNINLIDADMAIKSLKDNKINAWVGIFDSDNKLPDSVIKNELAWSVSPVLIMRTDTDIKKWQDLSNRTVCISKDSRYAGELESHYNAFENVYPTVTDALLALRIGDCDASLQEESFVNELLKYPEWQKFSARLQPYKNVNLVELQLADAVFGQQLVDLFDTVKLAALVKDQAKDIAFEVYLDQTVPDCH